MKMLVNVAGCMVVTMLLAGAGGCVNDAGTRDPDPIAAADSDARITTKVRTGLITRRQLSGARIYAKTSDGVVTLSGTARSRADIDAVIADTYQVTGVKSVVSYVFVKS